MRFTVFGATGFIGSSVTGHLRGLGCEVVTPARGEMLPAGEHLGHVVYAIGLTGDFRQRPFETVDAHVAELARRMQVASYDSWLYLSSTRVYGTSAVIASESDRISVMPGPDGIYDISKLLGESLCLALGRPEVRVARLSNVYGEGQSRHTFLGSLLADVAAGRNIVIREDPDSSKDYIAIADVVSLIEKIVLHGRHQTYNLASGVGTSHRHVAEQLRRLTAASVVFQEGAPRRSFPRMDVARITEEFGFTPRSLLDDLGGLAAASKPF
jgi:nucleoside-diphosphate-sugar epimerase